LHATAGAWRQLSTAIRHARTLCVAATGATEAPFVHVCTPAPSHAALARTAIAARRHVLVEKPFAATLRETDDVLAEAQMAGVLACPVHQFAFQRGVLAARAQLDEIGPLRHLQLSICSAGADEAPERRDEIAAEIVPHLLSLAAAFARVPLASGHWALQCPAAGEWIVSATLGDLGVLGRISMGGRPPMNELHLIGERGTIVADLFHGFATRSGGAGAGRTDKVLRPFADAARQGTGAAANLLHRALRGEPAYPGLRELIHRFHHAARTGAPAPIPADETRDIMHVWLRLRSLADCDAPRALPVAAEILT
jgi:predicted dehydrogenase